jgi:hypothetical protein
MKPICLNKEPIGNFVGKNATVAGWGLYSESFDSSDFLREVDVPIVDQTLGDDDRVVRTLNSELSFLAGAKDGSGPCNGFFFPTLLIIGDLNRVNSYFR